MCPGAADVANRIALLSDEDDIEIENRLAYATSKLLGATTVADEVSPARFFIDDEDKIPQDPTILTERPSRKNEHVELLLDNDESESLTALSNFENKVCSGETVKLSNSLQMLFITSEQLPTGSREQNEKPTDHIKPRYRSLLRSRSWPISGAKKSVRFADSVGQDLEHVRLFHSHKDDIENYLEFDSPMVSPDRQLLKRFSLSNKHNIFQVTEEQNVCLESISIMGMSVSGLIQVKNIAFQKQVYVRYTLDDWATYAEMPCFFSYSKVTNNNDVFNFSLSLPQDLPVGSCCEICIRYSTGGQDFWDSNNGANYKIDCCANDIEPDNWSQTQLQPSLFF